MVDRQAACIKYKNPSLILPQLSAHQQQKTGRREENSDVRSHARVKALRTYSPTGSCSRTTSERCTAPCVSKTRGRHRQRKKKRKILRLGKKKERLGKRDRKGRLREKARNRNRDRNAQLFQYSHPRPPKTAPTLATTSPAYARNHRNRDSPSARKHWGF